MMGKATMSKLCNWCKARPAVVIYRHASAPDAQDWTPYGSVNGPRCTECTPRNEYIDTDWRENPVMRPVEAWQLTPYSPGI
jgi:hypothetical protein